jgi:hypothetical protein
LPGLPVAPVPPVLPGVPVVPGVPSLMLRLSGMLKLLLTLIQKLGSRMN